MRKNGLSNELNIGLGLNYTIHEDERGVWFAEAGFGDYNKFAVFGFYFTLPLAK